MSQESPQQAADLLSSVFEQTGLDLFVELRQTPNGPVLDFDGSDADLLQAEGGELLDALQHLLNQAFGRSLEERHRFVLDVKGFRATREAELRAMAEHAAGRVRNTGVPFTFGAMTAGERRVIHLALAESTDLQTESIGEGAERKLRVSLKK